ncbi:DUF3320 domain-containing protein [Pseudomonas frederiksbergensis]|uniref:DUF3320 domain-containing protein n=1 Tax=Pseudomonas frederiksbergensis TaxID=104087 RepID=A0A2S8H8N6_9PSED|nr:hypothetical protein C5612_27145 [Pseudomonas frederiksbergensis]URM27047.1 DUF3320 domain-containing protein [Pseudomonas frederiksbergensis]
MPRHVRSHSRYTPLLQSMIAHVMNEEGPILNTVLARRIGRAHGWVGTTKIYTHRCVLRSAVPDYKM